MSHEHDLSERRPRNPFPKDKEVIQVSPGERLIGLLEEDSGCAMASMLSGYLHTQVKFIKFKKEHEKNRIVLEALTDVIDDQLKEVLMLERKCFSKKLRDSKYYVKENRFVNTKHGALSFVHFSDLRKAKRKLFSTFTSYLQFLHEYTGKKELVPYNFGNLLLRDLFGGVTYPLGKSILRNFEQTAKAQWTIEREVKEEVRHDGFGNKIVVNNTLNRYQQESHTVKFSNLWGSVSFSGEGRDYLELESEPNFAKIAPFTFHTEGLKEVVKRHYTGKYLKKPFGEKELIKGRWKTITGNDQVLVVGSRALVWTPHTGRYRMFLCKQASSLRSNPLTTLFSEGYWSSIKWFGLNLAQNWQSVDPLGPNSTQLISLGNRRILEFTPLNGKFRVWAFDPNVRDKDPFSKKPLTSGHFKSIREGHQLVSIGGDKIVDFDRRSRSFRVFKVNTQLRTTRDHILSGDPLIKGRLPHPVGANTHFSYLNSKVLLMRDLKTHASKLFLLDLNKRYNSLIHPEAIHDGENIPLREQNVIPMGGGRVIFHNRRNGQYKIMKLNLKE